MHEKFGVIADQKTAPTGKTLADALRAATKAVEIKPGKISPAADYEGLTKSVLLLGSVYKCGKCEHWHSAATATAWCVSMDGLMVTNHHVFQHATGDAWGICDFNGKVRAVTEILAGNEVEDVALFRVAAKNLTALPVGPDSAVGSNIRILSHPGGRC